MKAAAALAAAILVTGCARASERSTLPPGARASNVSLVGHTDLAGRGDGGEGLVIQQWPDGRRWLYLAHEAQQTCVSVVDVTRPEAPAMVAQLPSPAPGRTRCNSLALVGQTLVVANQTLTKGDKPAGMWVLDVSDPARVQGAKRLEDISVAFFDTSGPHSLHDDDGERCKAGGRFGAHNIQPNFTSATSSNLKNTVVASWFNGGVRIFNLANGPAGVPDAPPRLEEIGFYIPEPVPAAGGATQPSQINHAIVDERGLIYANDRSTGGLYILRYTGAVPLD